MIMGAEGHMRSSEVFGTNFTTIQPYSNIFYRIRDKADLLSPILHPSEATISVWNLALRTH